VIAAVFAYLVRRFLGKALVLLIGVVAVVWTWNAWGVVGWSVFWSLTLITALVVVQLVQGAGGTDPRLDAEEAERRAAIMRGDR
jgi:hypothetical protein